jgi:hypothetical protein
MRSADRTGVISRSFYREIQALETLPAFMEKVIQTMKKYDRCIGCDRGIATTERAAIEKYVRQTIPSSFFSCSTAHSLTCILHRSHTFARFPPLGQQQDSKLEIEKQDRRGPLASRCVRGEEDGAVQAAAEGGEGEEA